METNTDRMKNAIVTGGTSGIGLGVANMLLNKGYKVYATYKSASNKVKGVKDGTRSTWMVMTISN